MQPFPGGAYSSSGGRQYSAATLRRYRNSSPINFRLLLVNILLLVCCTYVLIASIDRYNTALGDLDKVTRDAALGATPCGIAVPKLKFLFQSLKEVGDDAFSEDRESTYVERARNALCATDSLNNALRNALQASEIMDDCCSEYDVNDPRYVSGDTLESNVRQYVCAANSESNGNGLGDVLRRIQHAYVLAAPAFAIYVDSDNGGQTCASPNDPFSETSCAPNDAAVRDAIREELSKAAQNAVKILAGEDETSAPWPTATEMLYRLTALAVLEFHDRTFNSGVCFGNVGSGALTPIELCETKLQPSIDAGRSMGMALTGGCDNAAEHVYYSERIGTSDSCTYTASTDDVSKRTPLWVQRERKFYDEFRTAKPVVAICAATLEFGLLDRKRYFGLPDPIGEYEFYSEHVGFSFTRWLAGIGYYSLFDSNKDKPLFADKHTGYLDLKLFVAHRYAVTSAWVFAAMLSAGYLFAFAAVPFSKLLYVRIVRSALTNTKTDTILNKPTSLPQTIALITIILVGLWVIFVDPAAGTPYYTTTECGAYAQHGGAYASSDTRAPAGLLGLCLILLGAGMLVYTQFFRRPPKRGRVFPLDPFPLRPVIIVILLEITALILLIVRAGDLWWEQEASNIDGSSVKTTSEIEEIVNAGFWILLFMGLVLGVLNQRHMAANVVLNVPRSQTPVFAIIWAAMAVTPTVLACLQSWPLFDCQVYSANNLVCGNNEEFTTQWSYFFGALTFLGTLVLAFLVFFAIYKVFRSVPRKGDRRLEAWSRSKEREIAELDAKRNRTILPSRPADTPGNPFATGQTLASNSISVSGFALEDAKTDELDDDDDEDVYHGTNLPVLESLEAPAIKFDLSHALPTEAAATIVPIANGTPVISASYVKCTENQPLIPERNVR